MQRTDASLDGPRARGLENNERDLSPLFWFTVGATVGLFLLVTYRSCFCELEVS